MTEARPSDANVDPERRRAFLADLMRLRGVYQFDPIQITQAMAIWDHCMIEGLGADDALNRLVPVLATAPYEQEKLRREMQLRERRAASDNAQTIEATERTSRQNWWPIAIAILGVGCFLALVQDVVPLFSVVTLLAITGVPRLVLDDNIVVGTSLVFLGFSVLIAFSSRWVEHRSAVMVLYTMAGVLAAATMVSLAFQFVFPGQAGSSVPPLARLLGVAVIAASLIVVPVVIFTPRIVGMFRPDRTQALPTDGIVDEQAAGETEPLDTPAFLAMTEALRRHISVPGRRLDTRATLRKTIRRGGLLSPVRGARRLRPETLFLIERLSPTDHLADLYTRTARRLVDQGVQGQILHYATTPARLFPDKTRQVRSPETLGGTPEEQRLVVFGPPQTFLNNWTAGLADWTARFAHWPHRMLLDPSQIAKPLWSRAEMALARDGWQLGAAREENLAALPRQIETPSPQNLLAGRPEHGSDARDYLQDILSDSGDDASSGRRRDTPMRIAICCDATKATDTVSNQSNIHRLYRALSVGVGADQRAYYVSGVGSGDYMKYRVDRVLSHAFGAAFGWGLERIIRDVYGQIARDYVPGDTLFFFGAERGGLVARHVIAMIRLCGLPPDPDDATLDRCIAHYRNRHFYSGPDDMAAFSWRYRNSPAVATSEMDLSQREGVGDDAHIIRIAYLGLWHTCGAARMPFPYGLYDYFKNRNLRFPDQKLSRLVQSARHAVALDEDTTILAPELFENFDELDDRREAEHPGRYQQLYFPGYAGTIVGLGKTIGLSQMVYEWVLEGAQEQGLDIAVPAKAPVMRFDNPMPKRSFAMQLFRSRSRRVVQASDIHPIFDKFKESNPTYKPNAAIAGHEPLPRGAPQTGESIGTERDYEEYINFEGRELTGRNFSNRRFAYAQFDRADLRRTDFSGARLHDCTFRSARLELGRFVQATLDNPDFRGADLLDCDLTRTTLSHVLAPDARMMGACFAEARVIDSDFKGVDVRRADFASARMSDVRLISVRAKGASFSSSRLTDVTFEDADLQEANFAEARLHRVSFRRANLTNAIFDNVRFDNVNFEAATLEGATFNGESLSAYLVRLSEGRASRESGVDPDAS